MKITITVNKCSSCNGSGMITIDSHDCWGKCESDEKLCSICGGTGFNVDSESTKKIKKELGVGWRNR